MYFSASLLVDLFVYKFCFFENALALKVNNLLAKLHFIMLYETTLEIKLVSICYNTL